MADEDDPLPRIEAALTRILKLTNSRRAHRRWSRQAGVDIGYLALRVLSTACSLGPVRASQLATALDLEVPLVSRELARLEDQGLITRVADGTDRRARIIAATPEGKRVYRRYRSTLDRNRQAAVVGWDERELRKLATMLERFEVDILRADRTAE
jgi:DNA-binding MarR family transcriptional regulator